MSLVDLLLPLLHIVRRQPAGVLERFEIQKHFCKQTDRFKIALGFEFNPSNDPSGNIKEEASARHVIILFYSLLTN